MDPIRLRFSKFCELLTGEEGPNATIRDILAKGDTPFDPKPPLGGQRTYDGEDTLKWLGFEAMRAVNVRLHQAAKLMRYGYAAEGFLEALEAGREVSDFHLFFAQGKPELTGVYQLHYKLFRPSEIADFLADQAANGPGIEHFVGVPLLPIYERAKARAKALGIEMVGGEFYPVAE